MSKTTKIQIASHVLESNLEYLSYNSETTEDNRNFKLLSIFDIEDCFKLVGNKVHLVIVR